MSPPSLLYEKGYRHQDQDFKALLKKVDGLRYAPSVDKETIRFIFVRAVGKNSGESGRLICKVPLGRCRGLLKYQGTIDPGNRP